MTKNNASILVPRHLYLKFFIQHVVYINILTLADKFRQLLLKHIMLIQLPANS